MGMYYCHECSNMCDSDDGCHESPSNELELVCPGCYLDLQERAEEEVNGEDFVRPRVPFNRGRSFSKEQMEIIRKEEAESDDDYME